MEKTSLHVILVIFFYFLYLKQNPGNKKSILYYTCVQKYVITYISKIMPAISFDKVVDTKLNCQTSFLGMFFSCAI